MSKILVFVESNNGKLKRSSQELLTAAKKSQSTVIALAGGSHATQLASECGQYGAHEVLTVTGNEFDNYNSQLFADILTAAINQVKPSTVLGSASALGKDLFPRVAARMNSGVLSDCVDFKNENNKVTAKKPIYSGKAIATMGFQDSEVQFVLMRANQLPVENSGGTANHSELSFAKPNLLTLIKEVVKGTSEKLDLTEANIIVSGGRGLKDAESFKLLNSLADVLGATVGASRAVVDLGWVGHGMQVGQTGKTVAPTLYIAVGISGAIQHLAGMSGSKVIVAINNDPNAPIFQKATYGLVGDLFDIVPKLTEEFKKVLSH